MNSTQIKFRNKLARMVLDYPPDDEKPVASMGVCWQLQRYLMVVGEGTLMCTFSRTSGGQNEVGES